MDQITDKMQAGTGGYMGGASAGAAIIPLPAPTSPVAASPSWSQRYGQRHRLRRITQWPPGVVPPRKVRIYWRCDHWVLQWWEPQLGQNISSRVDGDLIDAIAEARRIGRRLTELNTSGHVRQRIGHADLVRQFVLDLEKRAEACEIQPRSVSRFSSALAHYLNFAAQMQIRSACPWPAGADRDFALALGAYLPAVNVSPNGCTGAARRPMKSGKFVWDTVRAMYQWAADPDRGSLLPQGFRNPFLRRAGARSKVSPDPFGEPDVSVAMAIQLLEACHEYQLPLFATLVFYGLRAAEPRYLFREYLDEQWLSVPCNAELAYTTKGRRSKQLPQFEPLASLLPAPAGATALRQHQGLLFLRRSVVEGQEIPPLLGRSLQQLCNELQQRVQDSPGQTIAQRHQLRDQLLKEAGGIDYDQIEGEFRALATKLRWPRQATLKDLRHLFATSMANTGMPEPYRQYLMGHATSGAAINSYTHLNKIREQYLQAIEREWPLLLDVLKRRRVGDESVA